MIIQYRKHNPGIDYYQAGIYHITLVIGDRLNLFGELNTDIKNPSVILSELGKAVLEEWKKTQEIQHTKGRNIILHAACCMPDHFHGVIEVKERMDVSLGYIIQLFKAACTSRWRKLTGFVESKEVNNMIRHMSREQRLAYYLQCSRIERPLFDEEYDDTICLRDNDGNLSERHKNAMIGYVMDNPRRAIIRKLRPDMKRCLHLVIDGKNYSAFGNLFLLRWTRKIQVFCHRKARISQLTDEEKAKYGYTYQLDSEVVTNVPYHETLAFQNEQITLIQKLNEGQTVVVTPGISKGEQIIKNICLNQGFPMIHIQKDPIGKYWKPEKVRFEACEKGTLLILAPWDAEMMGEVSGVPSKEDFSIFHNLNNLAKDLCRFNGEAIVKK